MSSFFDSLSSYGPAISAFGNLFSGISGYMQANESSKAQRAFQAYQNTMARMSGAINQNAITSNELSASKALVTQGIGINQQTQETAAKVEVSAAAAGVAGNSVNAAQLSIQRNAAVTQRQREINLKNVYLSADQQQLQNQMQVQASQNYSYIPTPSLGSYLLPAVQKNFNIPGLFSDDPKASQATAQTITPLSSTYTPGQITVRDLPPLLR